MELILLGISISIILTLVFALNYTAGVVWRVEEKLDVSYKFFLLGIIFILVAETLDLIYPADNFLFAAIIVKTFRLLFALCFLRAVVVMRKIARKIDGEIEEKKKDKPVSKKNKSSKK